jgi:hypothetical protein
MPCRLGGAAIFLYRTVQSTMFRLVIREISMTAAIWLSSRASIRVTLDMHSQALSKGDQGSSLVPEQGTTPC